MESAKAQFGAIPWVDDALCQICHKCVARKVCSTKALIRLDMDEPPFVDASLCYGCMLCIEACPHGAIKKTSARELVGSRTDP